MSETMYKSFSGQYKELEERRSLLENSTADLETLSKVHLMQLGPGQIEIKAGAMELEGIKAVQNLIAHINANFDKLRALNEVARPIADVHQKGEKILESKPDLIYDELRAQTLALKKALSPHLNSFFVHQEQLKFLNSQVNRLRNLLNDTRFGEHPDHKSDKEVIQDKVWSKKMDESPKIPSTKELDQNLLIFSQAPNKHYFSCFSSRYLKTTLHEKIKLNRAGIDRAVDCIKYADAYIAKYSGQPEYKNLVALLQSAKQQNFAGEEALEVKKGWGNKIILDCKSAQNKTLMLHVLTECSNIREAKMKQGLGDVEFEAGLHARANAAAPAAAPVPAAAAPVAAALPPHPPAPIAAQIPDDMPRSLPSWVVEPPSDDEHDFANPFNPKEKEEQEEEAEVEMEEDSLLNNSPK